MSLPGGFGAGTLMGGLLFIVKFNGACLRPPIPRPITGNTARQLKYIDDSTQMASINLKKSLKPDEVARPRPLNYHERNQLVLKEEENILQQELNKFQDFTVKNKLVINSKKCFAMVFNRSKNYSFPPEFSLQGTEILEVKRKHKILGIIIQDDLKWEAQIQEMTRRATSTTWVIRRMKAMGVGQQTLVNFWRTEGRVHLELACPVWHSGLTKAQSQALDRAQRVAMAAISGRWEPSHTTQLEELGLEKLEPRRERLCLNFAKRTAENSRHMDIFQPSGARIRKGKKIKTYRETLSRTATHMNSAVPYLTRLLNSYQ